MVRSPKRVLTPFKSESKIRLRISSFVTLSKILEDETKDEMLIFEVLFNDSSPKSSTQTLEKTLESACFIFCSVFQNLRFMVPKRRFWKTEQKIGRVFSKHFSMVCEKCFENTLQTVCSTVQNLRLGDHTCGRHNIAQFQNPLLNDEIVHT